MKSTPSILPSVIQHLLHRIYHSILLACLLGLECNLPERKRDLFILFLIFLQGLEPYVEHGRYFISIRLRAWASPQLEARAHLYPPLIPRNQTQSWVEGAVQTFVELSSSIAFDKWWHSASTERSTCCIFIAQQIKSKLSLTTMKNRFCGQFGRKKEPNWWSDFISQGNRLAHLSMSYK